MLQFSRQFDESIADLTTEDRRARGAGALDSLEGEVEAFLRQLDDNKSRLARQSGPVLRILDSIDRRLRTEEVEFLDREGFPSEEKCRLARLIHFQNRVLRTYRTVIGIVRPLVEAINGAEQRPARVLEIACGSGRLTHALAREVKRGKLWAEVTGSDRVPAYVEQAEASAKAQEVSASFDVIDAYRLAGLPKDCFDIVVMLHAMHHFRPGQLARVIAGARYVSTSAFVGIDGYRCFLALAYLPALSFLQCLCVRRFHLLHDATLSVRKLYALKQLEAIARLAAPKDSVSARYKRPGYSVLTVKSPEALGDQQER